jgi:hypothetical protein
MQRTSELQVDLVEEFRLRAWARRNYVVARERQAFWHPVVLDEMRRKDDDGSLWADEIDLGAAYVPLVPTNTYVVHPGHASLREPHLFRDASLTERYYIG